MNIRNIHCEICGGNDWETLIENIRPSVCSGREVMYEGSLTKSMCSSCGFVYTMNSPLDAEIGNYYKEVYSSKLKSDEYDYINYSAGKYFSEVINDFVLAHDFPKEGKLLDIGCGKGFFEGAFAAEYPEWNLEGVDPSDLSIKFARKKSPKAVYYNRNFDGADYESDSYDLIAMHTVLNRVSPRKFIRESTALLKNRGIMSISIAVFPDAPFELYFADHTCMYFKEHLLSIAEEFNFELLKLDNKGSIWRFLFVKSSVESDGRRNDLKAAAEEIKQKVRGIVASWQNLFDRLTFEKDKGGKMAFYGAGTTLMILLSQTQFPKEQIAGIWDDNPHKVGEEVWGVEVKKTGDTEFAAECGVLCAGPEGIKTLKEKLDGYKNLLYYQ
ncbi:MAG: class I SAM-dependent methyltransferase [Candidatus Marinimicrobia bacterium]|nr:class I SAM-dependent methyltransferase [Candidatus Neomarinimicrobiota bacterium]